MSDRTGDRSSKRKSGVPASSSSKEKVSSPSEARKDKREAKKDRGGPDESGKRERESKDKRSVAAGKDGKDQEKKEKRSKEKRDEPGTRRDKETKDKDRHRDLKAAKEVASSASKGDIKGLASPGREKDKKEEKKKGTI